MGPSPGIKIFIQMNNTSKLSLGLNVILLVAVGFLYYMQFSSKGSSNATAENTSAAEDTVSIADIELKPVSQSAKIVFINYDSLAENYEFFKKIEKDMEAKIRATEQELVKKEQKLQEDYEFYMKNQQMMTAAHRESKEKELMEANNQLVELKEKRSYQLAQQERELNEKLMDNLYAYFKKLSKENNFDYILTYKRGIPGVVFGSDSLDITKQLVDGLNKEYKEKNKKK